MKERFIQVRVDVQRDFCPGGALAVEGGDEVVTPGNRLARVVRKTEGGLVVLTGDAHPTETAHFEKWPTHCVEGTKGAELHPDVEVEEGDVMIHKGQGTKDDGYSPFEGVTHENLTLEHFMLPRTAEETVHAMFDGLATDFCVRAGVLDALKLARQQKTLGRKVAVYAMTDAMRAVNLQPGDGARALKEMEAAGAILTTTDEMIAHINETRNV